MSFEGFDAALLESVRLPETLLVSLAGPGEAAEAGTLQAALQQFGAGDAEADSILAEPTADTRGGILSLNADEQIDATASFSRVVAGPEPQNGDDEVIVVTGTRDHKPGFDEGSGGPSGGGDNSGGTSVGGGGSIAPNPPEYYYSPDAACADGAAVAIAAKINQLTSTYGEAEYGGYVVQNSDGTFGADKNGLHTDHSAVSLSLGQPSSYANVFGIIHNHPYNNSNYNQNFIERYPSDADWSALDTLVANGASAANLSLYIVDPFGVVREFEYTDKAYYQSLDVFDHYDGTGLPAQTKSCS